LTVKIHRADNGSFIDRHPVLLPSLVWLLSLTAAVLALVLRGSDFMAVWPLYAVACVPGVLGVLFTPIVDREWVQIVLMLCWTALALLAVLTLGFIPMVVLFIAVPALAALFEREKVLEGTLIAALVAGFTWFAGRQGFLPNPPSWDTALTEWAKLSALAALLAFGLATLLSASSRRRLISEDPARTYWRDGVEGGLFEYDATGVLLGTNEQGVSQFSGNIPEFLLDFLPDEHVDKPAFGSSLETARRTNQPQAIRVMHEGSGERANYDLRLTPLNTDGWLIHSHDRTDEEAQIETLRQTGAMAQRDSSDKTLFFAGVSHELRTPLNAIIGFSDMMRSRLFGPLPNKYAEYADLIHESGQHMLDLIGDVLDLSKVEAGRYELNYDTFDAADVIRSSAKMIRPAADAAEVNLDINLDLDQALLIQADRRAVRQILLNLLSNAVKFSRYER